MTQKSEYHQTRQGERNLHYRLTSEEWIRACRELRPSEKDILYYLRTLDPFGDNPIDIKVREMARELNVSPSTVSRALKALDAKGWIDLEIMSARVKLHTNQGGEKVLPLRNGVAPAQHSDKNAVEKVLPQDNSVAPVQQVLPQRNKNDREATLEGEMPLPVENAKALQRDAFSDSEFSTECTRSVLKHLNKQTGSQANPSVEIDREDIGTLLGRIEAAGVSVNPAIAATLTNLYHSDPDSAAARVRNALSSLEEQDHIRSPQAFLNAALKRGFTANQAKQKRSQNSEQKQERTNVPPVRDLSGVLLGISLECERLGLNRDEAVQRLSEAYGWEPKQFADLDGDDMDLLLAAMTQWS
ncbi:MarR family transcriptional regulator [Oscillatoria sp. CS-180]|nr:MarR family transcriptional regulator [Oscillatoria sp. CS-180]